jgi:hypothetical protein
VLLSGTPTEIITPQELTTAAIIVPSGLLPNLDVDLNGQADALSNGIVIARYFAPARSGAQKRTGTRVARPRGARMHVLLRNYFYIFVRRFAILRRFRYSASGCLEVFLWFSPKFLSPASVLRLSTYCVAGMKG